MSEGKKPRPRTSLALTFARVAENLNQKEVMERSGVADLSDLEKTREPEREMVEALFASMGRDRPGEVDVALFCADLMRRPEPSAASPVDPTREEARGLTAAAAAYAGDVFDFTLDQLIQGLRQAKAKAHRQEAAALLKDLLARPAKERWALVEQDEQFRTWALAERAAFASVKLAAHDADQALDLARLAVRIAELTPGSEAWRARVLGLCLGFLANAWRVKGNFPAADETFDRSDRHWKAGASADPGLILDGTRLLDLKASLRRSQGRFEESLELLKQAERANLNDEATARLLLVKGFTLEQMGDWQGAIEALKRARPLVERQDDRRNRWVLEFNLCTSLCEAGFYIEASGVLPKVTRLAIDLGNGLDLWRSRWLRGRITAGQGDLEEAVADLEAVAEEFVTLGIAFDAARAWLDLAQLYLRQGRSAEVKRLAGRMVVVFKAQQVHREALAAVILFQHAAEQERATTEMVKRLSDYLRRAQHSPELRFEP